jgi:hypothetical protein
MLVLIVLFENIIIYVMTFWVGIMFL